MVYIVGGVIPDAATIYAMKKHRQMAREMGDFIPIEEPEKEDDEKSRLIRYLFCHFRLDFFFDSFV